jgi:hypothetical protein
MKKTKCWTPLTIRIVSEGGTRTESQSNRRILHVLSVTRATAESQS